jgi:hypothetical protein
MNIETMTFDELTEAFFQIKAEDGIIVDGEVTLGDIVTDLEEKSSLK